MDPIIATLVGEVMKVLVPYIKIDANEFVCVAGKTAYEKSKTLLDTLKKRLFKDKEATSALDNFMEKPERYQTVVEDILNEKLRQDDELKNEIEKLLDNMGPEIVIIQKMKIGEHITGLEVDEMHGGKTKVTQEIEQASNVTGAKIRRIGG
jgi:hypothetical protein